MRRLICSCALWISAGLLPGSPARAEDREIQALLAKLACVPAQITVTELSQAVSVTEARCKGSGRVVSIVCLAGACQVQPKGRDDDER